MEFDPYADPAILRALGIEPGTEPTPGLTPKPKPFSAADVLRITDDHRPPDRTLPYLELSETDELRGNVLRSQRDTDEEDDGEPTFSCWACGNAARISYREHRKQLRVCRACAEFLTRDAFAERQDGIPISGSAQNGPVRVSFDASIINTHTASQIDGPSLVDLLDRALGIGDP